MAKLRKLALDGASIQEMKHVVILETKQDPLSKSHWELISPPSEIDDAWDALNMYALNTNRNLEVPASRGLTRDIAEQADMLGNVWHDIRYTLRAHIQAASTNEISGQLKAKGNFGMYTATNSIGGVTIFWTASIDWIAGSWTADTRRGATRIISAHAKIHLWFKDEYKFERHANEGWITNFFDEYLPHWIAEGYTTLTTIGRRADGTSFFTRGQWDRELDLEEEQISFSAQPQE